jgi:hypothetical protein
MDDFFTAATGYAIDMELAVPALSTSKLAAFFAWKAKAIIGRLGGLTAGDYLYCDAALYIIPVGPSDMPDFVRGAGPWYASWGDIYKATKNTVNPGVGGALRGAYFPDPTSYWGNLQPAIAYAVQHRVAGAQEAYARMTSAPNWGDIVAGWNNYPVWGVQPNSNGGRIQTVTSLPAWVPPPGYFSDVPMLNSPQDVLPSLYVNEARPMDAPFALWGGSAILRDFSPLGAQVYRSAGHETSAVSINLQHTLICDFSTLRWSVANMPLVPNTLASFGKNGLAPDGTPYGAHTYLGLQELPASWGGAAKGSLLSFFWGGSNYPNKINVMDVSKANLGYSQMSTAQPANSDPSQIRFFQTSQGGTYPITVMDDARQGWWVAVNGQTQYTLFVSKTGRINQIPALGGNLQNGSMVLCSSLDLLIALDGGYSSGAYAGTGYRTLYIRNLKTDAVTRVLTVGTVPSLQDGYDGGIRNYHRPDTMGLQWVEELGCVVGFDQYAAQPTIVKLTPPANNTASEPWVWSTVTVKHWPQDVGGQASLQLSENTVWSKFRWVPSLQAFVYGTERSRKPQIVRL